jgi:hypothetical protein
LYIEKEHWRVCVSVLSMSPSSSNKKSTQPNWYTCGASLKVEEALIAHKSDIVKNKQSDSNY